MKTIGLVGGLSWKSTADYYRILNTETQKRTNSHTTPKILLYSVNFAEFEELVINKRYEDACKMLMGIAQTLEDAGADCILLCANTVHMFYDEIKKSLKVPLIHITEKAIAEIKNQNLRSVGLLGTLPTMEMDFLKDKYKEAGINIIVPEKDDRVEIHRIIFEELFFGNIVPESKARLQKIMKSLEEQGAEGIILGCTEIPLIIKKDDWHQPLFDTTELHALAAVDFVLQ